MLGRVALSVSLSLVAGAASAQQVNRVSGMAGEYHRVEDATVLANNDVALAGENYYFGPFTVTATLSRTAPDGTPLWFLSMDVVEDIDSGFGVRELDLEYLLFGFHTGGSADSLALARITGAGVPVWVRRYPGANSYGSSGIEIDRDISGEYGVVANRLDTVSGTAGQLLRIETLAGNVVFNRAYAPDGIATTSALFNDVDFEIGSGDYYVTGGVTRVLPGDRYENDILVARIQRFSGGVVWCRAYTLPPRTDDEPRYEEGYSIELASDGTVFVVARTDNPYEDFGPPGALNMRIDPADGDLLSATYIDDVQPAYASLDRLSNGNLLASGSRTFGDGQSQAQMWEIQHANAVVPWRAEYRDGQTRGNDAVEHTTVEGRFLTLTGSNYPYSIDPIGAPDQMFIQTDEFGDDGCSSYIWIPEPLTPEISSTAVILAVASVSGSASLQTQNFLSVLETAIVCRAGACVGDLNNDGFVDDADFVIFAAAYDLLDCFDPSMPPGCPADLNGDDLVDDADFVIFVGAYNELICP